MTRRDIEQRARLVIVRQLAVSPREVHEAADFSADLKADSLDMVSLTMALEEEFGIAVSDDEAAFCETVGTAFDLIENKLEAPERQAA